MINYGSIPRGPRKSKDLSHGYVYLIGNKFHHWYKIGITGSLSARMQEMQVGCPVKINRFGEAWVQHPRGIERSLHKKYSSRRLQGEWFLLQDEEVAEIQSYLTAIDIKGTLN